MKYKVNQDLKKAAALLLKMIIDYYEGTTEVAKATKRSRQVVHSFLTYGYIPLQQSYHFARALKVSVWAVSYVKLLEVFAEQSTPFETVVTDLPILSAEQKTQILKLVKKK